MDAQILLQAFLKGRQFKVKSGRFTFTYVRPDEMELFRMRRGDGTVGVDTSIVREKCIAWENVMEGDVVRDGPMDVPAPFSQMLFSAWIADHPEHWKAIGDKMSEEIEAYRKSLEALKGN